MKVKIPGLGVVEFPDGTPEEAIQAKLERFKNSTKPVQVVVTETKIERVPEIIREPQVVETEKVVVVYEPKVIEKEVKRVGGWRFDFERDENDRIETVYAEPYDAD